MVYINIILIESQFSSTIDKFIDEINNNMLKDLNELIIYTSLEDEIIRILLNCILKNKLPNLKIFNFSCI